MGPGLYQESQFIWNLKKNIDRLVDTITERRGFLGRTFKQTVEASNISNSTEMPYSLVKRINSTYRTSEKNDFLIRANRVSMR